MSFKAHFGVIKKIIKKLLVFYSIHEKSKVFTKFFIKKKTYNRGRQPFVLRRQVFSEKTVRWPHYLLKNSFLGPQLFKHSHSS